MFGGSHSRGSHIVSLVLGGHAAYRTQLFLYLKANGRDELNTYNLWGGAFSRHDAGRVVRLSLPEAMATLSRGLLFVRAWW